MDSRRDRKTGAPGIYFEYDGKTDRAGDFRFDRVAPGDVSIGFSEIRKKFVLASGEKKQLQLGGNGVPIIGRLLPPKLGDRTMNLSHADMLLKPQKTLDASKESNSDVSFGTHPKPDGTFRIDHVPAGDWMLTSFYQREMICEPVKITVAVNDPSEKNVGDLSTKLKADLKTLGDWNLNWPDVIFKN